MRYAVFVFKDDHMESVHYDNSLHDANVYLKGMNGALMFCSGSFSAFIIDRETFDGDSWEDGSVILSKIKQTLGLK